MGTLIVSTQMAVDGVIDVGEWYVAEGLAAYWSPLDDDWANLINPKPKYVASRTLHGLSSGTRRSWKAKQLTLSRDSRPSSLPTC
jgi:hypothetical protein